MQTEITKTLKQAAVSVLVFGAVLFAFSRVDWLNTFGLKETVVEDKLGELWWDVYSSDAAFVDDSLRVLPVDSLLDALCRANDIDRSAIFLHLVEDEEVNAFACPGNHLVVNTALLDSCHNADELSGVMAHELAHLTQGHVMQKLVKEIGLSALVVMTSGSGGTETPLLLTTGRWKARRTPWRCTTCWLPALTPMPWPTSCSAFLPKKTCLPWPSG